MNVCFRCNTKPTASALCEECKVATRAAISEYARPVLETRRAEAERSRARQAEAWNKMLAAKS